MPHPQPFGRSLVPLPGESLPGLLLRLSCRLNLPPAELGRLTGLTARGHSLHAAMLMRVPESARRAFAHATRLTGDQVTGLGLATWQERYPLPAWMPGERGRMLTDRWSLFAPATRYCPECLAGDGSAIQESFGGPWLKAWHLPVVFACLAHQRLLEYCCPECGQAARAGTSARPSYALLPFPWLAGLHPAQCRAERAPGSRRGPFPECCGARLDQARRGQHVSPGLLALQDKILRLLDQDRPASTVSAGMPASSASYFADLRALALLVYATWPGARHLSPSGETAAAIDQHVAAFRQLDAERRTNSPRPATASGMVCPPVDATAGAGLAHIADGILAGTPEEARWQIKPLLPASTREAARTSWARFVTVSGTPCSEGLQAAYKPLLRISDRPDGRPQGQRNPLIRTHRWGPENIPALIPEDWYDRHFTPAAGVSRKLARRTAALRLVQIITGGSLTEAAEFLGISSGYGPWRQTAGRTYTAGLTDPTATSRKTRQQPDPPHLETGLKNLTRELSSPGTTLINYQRRRQAMKTWSINKNTWPEMAAKRSVMSRPLVGDHARQVASVYVWARVTSGEPRFAPRPIQAAQSPEVQQNWERRWDDIWGRLLYARQNHSYHTLLRGELEALAVSLAETIDSPHHRAGAASHHHIAGD